MRPGFQTSRFVCLWRQSRQNRTEIESLASRTSFATLQLRFPKNDIMNSRAPNLIAAVIIAGLASVASAKDTYKFDPSGSTIGFSVHQFLGTTRGKFTNFSGKIEILERHAWKLVPVARLVIPSAFVIPSEVEESLTISLLKGK